MKRHVVPYRCTHRFAPIVLDYLESAENLREHFQWSPDRPGLERAQAERSFDERSRAVLCEVLRDQYRGLEVHEAVQANLSALADQRTVTVTTGHQLCLFSGPLYVPFKLLNVIRLARQLSTEKRPVVPVFWMATEDHDRAEIDHAWINGSKVTWPGGPAGAVGDLLLQGIEPVIAEAERLLGHAPHTAEVVALLKEHYRSDRTLAQATCGFIHALFGRFGLVIIDANDPRLKRLFVPIMREELLNGITERTVAYANERLSVKYAVQAHAREVNLFYLSDRARRRIELQGDRYAVLDGGPSSDPNGLLQELDQHPERFSPNVLMRPLYQETVLPNIAYVGGGGELAYWLQLRWLFQAVRVPMPVLLLRTSAGFIAEKHMRQWKEFGLAAEDLFRPRTEVEADIAMRTATFRVDLSTEREKLTAAYLDMAEHAGAADPTLVPAVKAKEARALKGLDALESKLLRAAKRQQVDALRRADAILDAFLPEGLQERRDNFLPFYAAKGPAFLDELLSALDPLDPQFSILVQ